MNKHIFRTVKAVEETDVSAPSTTPPQSAPLFARSIGTAPEAKEVLNLIMSQGTCPANLTNLLVLTRPRPPAATHV